MESDSLLSSFGVGHWLFSVALFSEMILQVVKVDWLFISTAPSISLPFDLDLFVP